MKEQGGKNYRSSCVRATLRGLTCRFKFRNRLMRDNKDLNKIRVESGQKVARNSIQKKGKEVPATLRGSREEKNYRSACVRATLWGLTCRLTFRNRLMRDNKDLNKNRVESGVESGKKLYSEKEEERTSSHSFRSKKMFEKEIGRKCFHKRHIKKNRSLDSDLGVHPF
ncbi:hypothetical protein CEXT_270111 [Caerostris extrusa]|uniref:Uncharacterized protein n=1 Tax=Caerostris extrusa TaxID=172846 RepID=A0AAV4Q4G7_CAEEX|nr:hypothetical protein CEXT_270111 [Caerostris extrusa]